MITPYSEFIRAACSEIGLEAFYPPEETAQEGEIVVKPDLSIIPHTFTKSLLDTIWKGSDPTLINLNQTEPVFRKIWGKLKKELKKDPNLHRLRYLQSEFSRMLKGLSALTTIMEKSIEYREEHSPDTLKEYREAKDAVEALCNDCTRFQEQIQRSIVKKLEEDRKVFEKFEFEVPHIEGIAGILEFLKKNPSEERVFEEKTTLVVQLQKVFWIKIFEEENATVFVDPDTRQIAVLVGNEQNDPLEALQLAMTTPSTESIRTSVISSEEEEEDLITSPIESVEQAARLTYLWAQGASLFLKKCNSFPSTVTLIGGIPSDDETIDYFPFALEESDEAVVVLKRQLSQFINGDSEEENQGVLHKKVDPILTLEQLIHFFREEWFTDAPQRLEEELKWIARQPDGTISSNIVSFQQQARDHYRAQIDRIQEKETALDALDYLVTQLGSHSSRYREVLTLFREAIDLLTDEEKVAEIKKKYEKLNTKIPISLFQVIVLHLKIVEKTTGTQYPDTTIFTDGLPLPLIIADLNHENVYLLDVAPLGETEHRICFQWEKDRFVCVKIRDAVDNELDWFKKLPQLAPQIYGTYVRDDGKISLVEELIEGYNLDHTPSHINKQVTAILSRQAYQILAYIHQGKGIFGGVKKRHFMVVPNADDKPDLWKLLLVNGTKIGTEETPPTFAADDLVHLPPKFFPKFNDLSWKEESPNEEGYEKETFVTPLPQDPLSQFLRTLTPNRESDIVMFAFLCDLFAQWNLSPRDIPPYKFLFDNFTHGLQEGKDQQPLLKELLEEFNNIEKKNYLPFVTKFLRSETNAFIEKLNPILEEAFNPTNETTALTLVGKFTQLKIDFPYVRKSWLF